jgi:replication factor A1
MFKVCYIFYVKELILIHYASLSNRILIVINLDVVVAEVDSKIGAPVTLETHVPANTGGSSATSATSSPASTPKTEPQSYATSNPMTSQSFSSGSGANMQLEASLTPIKNLNPYQTRWTIKARITQKSPIRKWHNARGDGQLFSVNLLDQTVSRMREKKTCISIC